MKITAVKLTLHDIKNNDCKHICNIFLNKENNCSNNYNKCFIERFTTSQ